MAEVDYEHVSKVYAGSLQAIADFCRCPRVRWAVPPAFTTQARIDRVAAESHHGVGEGVAGDATFEPVGNPQARARFPPLLPQNFVRT